MASTASSECGAAEQTADHIITSCPIHGHPNGIRGLLTVNESLARCLIRALPFRVTLLPDATSHPHEEEVTLQNRGRPNHKELTGKVSLTL